jgi:hypothetical protein
VRVFFAMRTANTFSMRSAFNLTRKRGPEVAIVAEPFQHFSRECDQHFLIAGIPVKAFPLPLIYA